MRKNLVFFLSLILLVIMLYTIARSQDINDPLINSSVGSVHGGTFIVDGWKTNTVLDYIQYNVPTISSGTVEFDVKGIYASNTVFPNYQIDKYGNEDQTIEDIHYQLINFWDRDESNSYWGVTQWHNKDKMILHLYGYVVGDVFKWKYIEHRLNVDALDGGYEDSFFAFGKPAFGPFDWQKDTTYHHKLVWGNGHFLWYMNNVLITDRDYSSWGKVYAPPYFSIRLGSAILGGVKSGGLKCPIGITYSNFKFYENADTLILPEVVEIEATKEEGRVATTSDILISFNKLMNLQSIKDNLTVYPTFSYEVQMKGNTVCIRNTSVLQSNTYYSVALGELTSDGENTLGSTYVYAFQTNKSFPDTLYLYESHDFPIIYYGINYQTTFGGVFTNGDREIILDGFWDNYNVGKVRFAPDKLGVWNYNINGTIGTFICVNSNSKGFITTNGTNFQYANRESWKWIGNTVWRGYTSLMPYMSRWKELIDLCKEQDYTAVQSIVHSYINGNAFWMNEGGQCFAGATDADYNNLNPEYFRWIDKRVNYALSKDIVPVIFMTWTQDFGLFTELQFSKYVKYIVSRYCAKNVIWIICGEYSELPNDFPGRQTSEFNTWGMLVHQKDPYNHPTSLHPTGRSTSAEFANTVWMDFIGQQTPYSGDVTRDLTYDKPVVVLEPRYYYPDSFQPDVPNTVVRQQLYEIVKNGGYYTAGFYTTYAKDKAGFDLSALPEEQRWTRELNRLVKAGAFPASYEEYLSYLDTPQVTVPEKVKNVHIIK